MRIRQSTAKALAVLTLFALVAAACGGGSDTDVADSASDASPAATSTPLAIATDDVVESAADDGSQTSVDSADDSADDPWEVSVLYVNDDVQIIPVFDAPNGNNITLYDINAIDGTELEYPLYAETSFGNRLALLVTRIDDGGNWAEVQVPVRPNGTTAWVQTAFFTKETHNYHITINVTTNKVNVYKGDEMIVEQIAVTGRESRPTPIIRAYIDEKIRGETLSPAYGDWVLSIAAFSEALGTYGGGGMPKLALHGTDQPDLMGQYASSGCVRVPNEIVSFIADTVPVGTVVDIIA